MNKRYVLGVDLGTSSIKASILDLKAKTIITESIPLSTQYPDPFSAEQNPEEWWQQFCLLMAKLKDRIGGFQDIGAIGLSGQMLGLVLIDDEDRVVRPCLIWCDQRSHRETEEIEEKLGLSKIVQLVANTPLPGYWLPKILWLRKHEPSSFRRAKKLLLPKDFLRLKLTGEYVTDVSDASGTLLFDVARRQWSAELAALFSVDQSLFPEVVESPVVTGFVNTKASLATGLPKGIPVVGGGGDQSSGGIGLGIIYNGVMSCVLGTSGVVMAKTDDVKLDFEKRGLHSFCYSLPGKWFLMGCTLAAGGSFQWIRNALREVNLNLSFSKLNDLAGNVPPGSEGLLFLPYLIGERTPHSDPLARGAFIGLSYRHTLSHLVRAVIEGVAFSQKDSLEVLRSFSLQVDRLVVSGGAAQSTLWCQILADVTGVSVQTTNVDDPASVGAAIIAGVGTGAFSSFEEACSGFVRPARLFEPNTANTEKYSRTYELYRESYKRLRELFPALTHASTQEE
ncbi:MAG: xylulokinase [Nitrososphaerota archaeon]